MYLRCIYTLHMSESCREDRILLEGNNNTPFKLSIQLMNYPYFMFTCANCRDFTTSPSAMSCHLFDPMNMTSIQVIIIRVESSLVDLKNQSSNITYLLIFSNYTSHPSSISNPSHITTTNNYISLLTNYSPSISSHHKSTHIPVPITPSLVIENLFTSQRNMPYLKYILSKLDLTLILLYILKTTINFKYNHAFLT